MTRRFALMFAVILLAGCGGSDTARSDGPPRGGIGISGEGTAGDEAPPRAEGAIELTLRRADGTFLDVGELRGNVTLLYVFATFDGISQMLLHPLRQVAERHPDVQIVGIAAQPSARLLVDAYVHALSPPFAVTYDPEDTVQAGTSALGAIEVVPVVILLDEGGAEVERHTGFMSIERMEEMLAAAGVQ
ncbi:MAG: TlpA family protein disulfide reductase [Sandaracinaceae bacterium]